jgi:hypothetical protein
MTIAQLLERGKAAKKVPQTIALNITTIELHHPRLELQIATPRPFICLPNLGLLQIPQINLRNLFQPEKGRTPSRRNWSSSKKKVWSTCCKGSFFSLLSSLSREHRFQMALK